MVGGVNGLHPGPNDIHGPVELVPLTVDVQPLNEMGILIIFIVLAF